jgi:hypothetical protein
MRITTYAFVIDRLRASLVVERIRRAHRRNDHRRTVTPNAIMGRAMRISYDEAGAIACLVLGGIILTILVARFAMRRRD